MIRKYTLTISLPVKIIFKTHSFMHAVGFFDLEMKYGTLC